MQKPSGKIDMDFPEKGRERVKIENLSPEVDGGQFPCKRVLGEKLTVKADIFSDGHDVISAQLLYRFSKSRTWKNAPMILLENDRWVGEMIPTELGIYIYTVEGWVDHFKSWQRDFKKRVDAGQDVEIDLKIGTDHIEKAAKQATEEDQRKLLALASLLRKTGKLESSIAIALGDELTQLIEKYPVRQFSTRYEKELQVVVDPPKALFSTWYERFPRSCSPVSGKHGSFKDCEILLPEIARMGFDVLYLPPIHPIGEKHRKGKNNSTVSTSDDPGSPWAIGSAEGGHTAVHSKLGNIKDFDHLVKEAKKHGIDIALDVAFQCSPDHPYVKSHSEWFRWRPDGTVQYAENPPKKYEDILPINFETEEWKSLWEELRSIVEFWIGHGVRIFRVDNPHTKPFSFWEWMIPEIKKEYPEVIFLSEAFTRPKVMYRLAKGGFTQSYTYFTWRNTKEEFISYLTELTQTQAREFFRPNFWTNTPDILPEHLQFGGRPAFLMRLILAATLSSNYGMYGPAFELCLHEARPGVEEYIDNEKYEIKTWDWDQPGNLKDFITRLNKIRRANKALQTTWNLSFCENDNEKILSYIKTSEDLSNIILVIVNLDPFYTQSGWVKVPIRNLGIETTQTYMVHDLLSDEKHIWQGENNFFQLNPHVVPAHIFLIKAKLKRETDFDYFM